MLRKTIVALLAGFVALLGVTGSGERLTAPTTFSMISSAEAIVGRPLTPVSYAGVARRTARRY